MRIAPHHVTAAADRLPMSQKIAYGLGGIVPIALANIVYMLMGIIGNIGLGISALLLGLVMAVPRLWDAFTDPLMGHISDNTRSRRGRRRPYILWGGVAVCVIFVVMWWIPKGDGASTGLQLGYILLLMLLFYTAVTVFEIPHGALGMEMTSDYHERTRLFSAKSFIGNVFAMATPWLYGLAQLDFFKGAGGNETDGMRYVSIIVALLVLPCVVICYALCREGHHAPVEPQRRPTLKENLGVTFRNRTFLRLVCIVFMVIMGFNFVGNFANYITIFYLFGGDKVAAAGLMGVAGTVWAVTSLVAILPMNWISSRVGKTRTMLLAIALMATAQLSKVVCYNPAHPYLLLVPTMLLSAGMVMYFTLASAMVADVCDEDELHTGRRNEGAYYSIFWWFMKLGMAFAGIVAGVLLLVAQFDNEQSSRLDGLTAPVREWIAALEADEAVDANARIEVATANGKHLADYFAVKQQQVPGSAHHYQQLAARTEALRDRLQALDGADTSRLLEEGRAILEQSRAVSRQSPVTVLRLRVFEIGLPLLLCIASLLAMRRYPLSEDRMYEIKAELERRKGQGV